MKGSRQVDTQTPTASSMTDEVVGVLGEKLGAKYAKLRRQFEADHPELFSDDRGLLPMDRVKIQSERNRAWTLFLGLEIPPVPSALDSSRDASCLRCHDVGWVHPGSHAKDASDESFIQHYVAAVIPCPHCNSQEDARVRARLAYAGIPDTQKAATFESFKKLPGTEAAFSAAHDLVFGAQFYMVLLTGSYGNGKTHLCYAAVREAARLGMRARFIYFPDMLAEYRRRIDRNEEPQVYIEEVKRVAFLGLDEIGFTNATAFQEGLLEEIVNHRYDKCLHTIMTTNRDVTKLPGAILSRFTDRAITKMVLNKGVDFRPKKKSAKSVGPGTTD